MHLPVRNTRSRARPTPSTPPRESTGGQIPPSTPRSAPPAPTTSSSTSSPGDPFNERAMETATRVWPLILFLGCCSAAGCQDRAKPVDFPFPVERVELRPAEAESGDGLE